MAALERADDIDDASAADEAGTPAPARLETVSIRGFRSFRDVEFSDIGMATVLIGANGSGKSNFIRFFEMVSWMLRSRELQSFVAKHGGGEDQLFGGSRKTPTMSARIRIRTERGLNDYAFTLASGADTRLYFSDERWRFAAADISGEPPWQLMGSGHREAMIMEAAQGTVRDVNAMTAHVVCELLRNCATYQFHDTSENAPIKERWDISDRWLLRSHGGNLAAVLYRLQHEDIPRYETICRQIRRVLPVFERFDLVNEHGKVLLRWKAHDPDKTIGAHLTSDGSLRFFALVTLLNLAPEQMPDVVLLDEPELGLHPAAIALLGSMIKSVAAERQVIVATQSPLLVDAFGLDEVVVLELKDGATAARRLESAEFQRWLADGFTTGELWQTNLLGGRP